MKEKLLIIGAGGHGKVIADIAIVTKKWKKVDFLDDMRTNINFMDASIIGRGEDVEAFIKDYDLFVGIGDNEVRKRLILKLESLNASIVKLIHPNAVIGSQVEISKGTVVMAGAIINCSTKIGKGCIINTGVTIDHDNIIEDFVHISPGANLAGNVKIGSKTWVGIGSTVINNVNIAKSCTIGAASLVLKDILIPGIFVGVPVRRLINGKDFNSGKQ